MKDKLPSPQSKQKQMYSRNQQQQQNQFHSKIKGGAHRNTNSMSVVSYNFEFILSTKKAQY
jgi:hypothetical protein